MINRRSFLKTSTLTGIGLLASSQMIWANSIDCYSIEELTGQVQPELVGKDFRLRKEVAEAFTAMQKAALADGIKIYSVSSYRSFQRQKGIWDRKYARYTKQGMTPQATIKKIIEYSTIPGTSRHHWGTDMDIVDTSVAMPSNPLNEKHFLKGGIYEKLYQWLSESANNYGFYEVYTNNSERKGFNYEPWHYTFMDTSLSMLEEYLKIDLNLFIQKSGIQGSAFFDDQFVSSYINENILGINPILKV